MRNRLLVTLSFAALALLCFASLASAAKPTIGVAEFTNRSGAAWWRGGMGWEISGAVANELASGGKFRVLERSKLEHVLREQDLGASGRVQPGTAAKIGKLTGAQYLILGTVTSYEESVAGTGGGISIGPFSIGGESEDAYIALDLRVADTTTGELVHVRTVEASSSGGGLSLGFSSGLFGADLGGFEKTPAGKAVRACIIEIVEYLECVMVDRDGCEADYQAKERARRQRTKDSISLQ